VDFTTFDKHSFIDSKESMTDSTGGSGKLKNNPDKDIFE
jgi:hypothetical protein